MLLLIMTMAGPKWLTPKDKLLTYTRILLELYNERNCGQVHEIHNINKLKKMRGLTKENLHNLGAY